MKKSFYFWAALLLCSVSSFAADWDGIPVPANAGAGNKWQLQSLSDDFSYNAPAVGKSKAFYARWDAGFINAWKGPGQTEFYAPNSSVANGKLILQATRKPGTSTGVRTGIIHSNEHVHYPIYMEARIKGTNATLANAFWLLSSDSTQEIDVMEAYGSDRPDQKWFDERMHVSHHVFIRQPFQDYQPKDSGSWYLDGKGTRWRNDFHTYGAYWRDPWNIEYYIDGVLVRKVSGENIIDPLGYTGGKGLNKPMQVIFDIEDQNWRSDNGIRASNAELSDPNKNRFQVDWVRFYKPVPDTSSGSTVTTAFDSFISTNKNGNAVAGDIHVGFNKSGNGRINFNTSGDYADYMIPLTEDGRYRIEIDVATPASNGLGAKISVDGKNLGSITVSNTGGWGNFQTFSLDNTATLNAGTHSLRIESTGSSAWQWNGDTIRFVKVGN